MAELRVGVMGAGAVGCYVGGLLSRNAAVILVGRPRLQEEIRAAGLVLKDLSGREHVIDGAESLFVTEPERLADVDAVLCCVKSGATEEVGRTLAGIVKPGCVIVSLQNGLRNPTVLKATLPRQTVLAGIVAFNVIWGAPGRFAQTTKGGLLIEASDSPKAQELFAALEASGIGVGRYADIESHQWSKLLVNLNNAVSALSDVPTRDMVLSSEYRRVIAELMDEGLSVLRATGRKPAPLRGIPVGVLPKLLRLPTPVVKLVARAQLGANPEARSSMWEDLNRRRKTEVDYLNGEIVRIAKEKGLDAPLNRRMVELVHQAEAKGAGSPGLSASALLASR